MTLEEALNRYADRFNDSFPIMCMMGTPETEIIDLIKKALDSGKPYELPPDDSELPPLY